MCRKLDFAAAFPFFTACGRQPDKALQKQKSIRNLCIFGAEQFKTSRFLTQFQWKDTVLTHIGFDSLYLTLTVQPNLSGRLPH